MYVPLLEAVGPIDGESGVEQTMPAASSGSDGDGLFAAVLGEEINLPGGEAALEGETPSDAAVPPGDAPLEALLSALEQAALTAVIAPPPTLGELVSPSAEISPASGETAHGLGIHAIVSLDVFGEEGATGGAPLASRATVAHGPEAIALPGNAGARYAIIDPSADSGVAGEHRLRAGPAEQSPDDAGPPVARSTARLEVRSAGVALTLPPNAEDYARDVRLRVERAGVHAATNESLHNALGTLAAPVETVQGATPVESGPDRMPIEVITASIRPELPRIATAPVHDTEESAVVKSNRPPESLPGLFATSVATVRRDETAEVNPPPRTTIQAVGDAAIRAVRYLTTRGEETLIVRLVPESLGELHVAVRSHDGGLEVRLASAHAAVRDALEHQLHALREALAREGAEVARVTVSSNPQWDVSHGNHAGRYGPYASSSARYGPPPDHAYRNEAASRVSMRETVHQGMLDVFA